ncbi:MAG: hypothetical protein FD174_1731 [Geobacteraceae bacterium]|nr:MAG: hypothetical protein FD174_1731 [Geobacteraceae bacterium]
MAVSILARLCRRALLLHFIPRESGIRVSILARLCRRALHRTTQPMLATPQFQSSPAFADGRYTGKGTPGMSGRRFNPRPPLQTGATRHKRQRKATGARFNPRPPLQTGATIQDGEAVSLPGMFQSSPAFADGRYTGVGLSKYITGGFNPRPPLQTGATLYTPRICKAFKVSILARLCRRALLSPTKGYSFQQVTGPFLRTGLKLPEQSCTALPLPPQTP